MTQPLLTEEEIVRAWKDESFLWSLTEEQRRYAGEHYPAGAMELSDEELEQIAGGQKPTGFETGCWYESPKGCH